MRRGRNHFKLFDNFVRKLTRLSAIEKHRFSLAVASKHHVVHDVHIAHKPHAEPIFRHERKANTEFADLQRRFIFEIDNFVLFEKHFSCVDKLFDLFIGFARKIYGFAVFVAERALFGKLFHPVQIFMEKRNRLIFFGIVKNHIAAFETLQPRDRFEKLFLTAAGNTRNAENLARFRRERYVVKHFHAVVIL